MKYALLDYDVQDTARNIEVYPVIYKHLTKVAMRYTDSVYLVNLAHYAQVGSALLAINNDLKADGKCEVRFHITKVDPSSEDEVRVRSVAALSDLITSIGKGLLSSIEKMEQRFDALTDDPNNLSKSVRNRVLRAARELKSARALAFVFGIEKDAEIAVDATDAIIRARKIAAGIKVGA